MLRRMVEESDADELHKRVEGHKLESMLGYCELTSCRRQTLLNYFGDKLEQPCGNCDNCLNPAQTWDATEAARKALSCAYRTGQRFGARHVIDVLLGKSTERVRRFGHDALSTFGIGKELAEQQWQSVFRQLVTQGFLVVDWEQHGAMRLADACRPILRGEQTLSLRLDEEKKPGPREARRTTIRFSSEADETLWQDLRILRKRLAEEQKVPPYVILHDVVLQEMVQSRPQTLTQLSRIAGIGERKLTLYGDEFLAVITQHGGAGGTGKILAAAESVASPTAEESLSLFRLGMSVEQIAARRGFKPSTIFGHLAQVIGEGKLDVLEVTGLNCEEAERMRAVWLALPAENRGMALKPWYEALGGRYDYGILRCLREAWGADGA
jgi:ATP-dependent DNA helicase RecQ